MNIQSIVKKGKFSGDIVRMNRGDVMSLKSSIPPHDHGDVKIQKESKKVKKTPEKPRIHVDLIANLMKTSVDCVPSVKSENPGKTNLEHQIRSEIMDFRKRIKDRYTIKLKNGTSGNECSKSICTEQSGVKNEMRPRYDTFQRRIGDRNYSKLNVINKNENNISIHKAISARKIKEPVKPKPKDLVEKKNQSLQTDIKEAKQSKCRNWNNKELSKTKNERVCKVSFVNEKQPNLDTRISHKEVKRDSARKTPIRSKLALVPGVQMRSPNNKRRQLSGKRKVAQRAQIASKSIDTLPEVAIVPESVNPHTKPYYEAWVNKTLTATSKYSKKYKDCFDKTKVLKALEMRSSTQMMHASSEPYAGRIRVRQRSKKERRESD